jgi:DNA-binding Xre family transcriptional regulator
VKRLPAVFYALPSGREPVRDWLRALDADDRKVIGEDIKDVEFSWPIGMPLCRALGQGLWEVRSALTQGRIARVLFCIHSGRMVLLQEDPEDAGSRTCPGGQTQEGDYMKKKRSGRIGSSFDDFLKETGIYEEVTARAIKRVIARQLDALMQDQGLTKSALAKRMHTSRAQLDRLLDPENESVTLGTLARAAQAVGRQLRMELV